MRTAEGLAAAFRKTRRRQVPLWPAAHQPESGCYGLITMQCSIRTPLLSLVNRIAQKPRAKQRTTSACLDQQKVSLCPGCLLVDVSTSPESSRGTSIVPTQRCASLLLVFASLLATSTNSEARYEPVFNSGFEEACSEDADRDGLANCTETNTGIYVSGNETGTDPANPDTDQDGLLDGEEVLGTSGGLNLPALGVSPVHKDILIEYDWFDDANECVQHSHRPNAVVIDELRQFFLTAPVSNPDNLPGINLIQDYGQGGLLSGGNHIVDASNPSAIILGGVHLASFQAYEAANFAPNRRGYFHYALMAHRYDPGTGDLGSSGNAAIVGSELMVTLSCWAGLTTSLAKTHIRNTIAHELGHNLGLRHGGDEDCTFKPNYSSIMNYQYQFPGIDTSCLGLGDLSGNEKIGFSRGERRSLDEEHLDETAGMCTDSIVPVDWNGDAILGTSVAFDLNSSADFDCGGAFTVLHDFNDWIHLDIASVSPSFASESGAPIPKITTCAPIPLL
jgi:hypothetical protein